MKEFTYTITDPVGIHARPAGQLVKAAKEFASTATLFCGELGADITLTETFLRMGVDELSVNAKSVLGLRKVIRSVDLSKPANS